MAAAFTQALEGAYGKTWKISSKMGWRIHPVHKTKKHHNGTDIIGMGKDPIYVHAIANGRVLKTRKSDAPGGGFGYYVVIRHYIDGQFYTSLYAHLAANTFQVKAGQKVNAGDVIGKMGSTGMSTGRHLHLEIWKGRTHGWSADGTGFIEPIGFIKAMSAAQDAKSSAKVATPPKAKVQPIAVHEPAKKPASKPAAKKPTTIGGPENVAKAPPKKALVKKVVDKPATKVYTIKSGDTLGKIARANKTTVSALQKINGIKNSNVISVGQKIKLS
jgi:murein DD-endopeptidase MepM/ murein hydrolase activator NlpD